MVMMLEHSQSKRIATNSPRFLVFAAVCATPALVVGPVFGQVFVPFVIPAEIDDGHAIWMNEASPISVDSERLRVRNAHFQRGDGRVRVWGVNLSFGANFPTHEDASRVASRLAAAGVNSVRCHHMDTARWPRGLWDAETGTAIEPEALDRLDHSITELAQRGIVANINLHVGREHSQYVGLPATNRKYDKISGIFTPELIEAQKRFAKDLLDRTNRYRSVRYADDPAVAFVEITNEDSFFMWNAEETLRTLPRHYAGILRAQFNQWLRNRYESDETLRAAWSKGTQPLGDNMIENGQFEQRQRGGSVPYKWNLEQHDGCRAKLSLDRYAGRDAVKVQVDQSDDTIWHLQFSQRGFPIKAETYYTLSFDAIAPTPRAIQCGVSQAHDPWGNLGLSRTVELTDEWRTLQFGFIGEADDSNARMSFAFSGDDRTFYLANVELRPGGQVTLAEGESLDNGNVALFATNEARGRVLDRMVFLAETEKAYFDGMRSYIKNDLRCEALVTGTIVFGPLGLYAQSDMDFIDSHAYWQHPRFPGRPWDAGNWTVEQKPMTDHPSEATLFRLAAERLAGKPFTCSEYNHPAPMDAQAECVPMIASFAAAQDWDGVWLYTYSHSSDDWDRQHLNSYFDIDTNPAKWGFMRTGTALFRDERLKRIQPANVVPVARFDEPLAAVAELHLAHDRDMLAMLGSVANITYEAMLEARVLPNYSDANAAPLDQSDKSSELNWSVANAGGIFQAVSRQAQVYSGHANLFEAATGGRIRIASPSFVALTITTLDAGEWVPLEASRKILIAACGRCENTGMKFSADRRTVGRQWGTEPVQIETVSGTMGVPDGRWRCHALAPDGSKDHEVNIVTDGDGSWLQLSPEHKTMWYLLESLTR
jgi:hypothetical protein